MSENSKNQSKKENSENNKDTVSKKEQNNQEGRDKFLREFDKRLCKLEEENSLADYDKASDHNKNQLKDYLNQLDPSQKQELKQQLEDYPHGENNYLQLMYNLKYEKVFRFSRFYQTVLNNSLLTTRSKL